MTPAQPVGLVFGYGSLSADLQTPGSASAIARLGGWRRVWNVAMDNTESLPGYKHYLDPVTGDRPAVFVTYLNIEQAPGAEVVGALLAVCAAELAALDLRERNYTRVEIGRELDTDFALPVWAYAGTDAARGRFERGLGLGSAVIQRDYVDAVEQGFERLGCLGEYLSGTIPPACPVRALARVDHL